ncbi:MAG: lysophospholipid acyltransferase family protein [Pseudomonadota bacterium]
MRLLRDTTKIGTVQEILCWLTAQYLRLVWLTGRWQVRNADAAVDLLEKGKPLIIAGWHGRLLLTPFGWPNRDRTYILVSSHNDGQLISRTLNHLKFNTVRGSTHHGGTEALRKLRAVIRDGNIAGITPDGPRGPRMRVSPGVIQLARLTGAPIFPLTFSAKPRHVFDSWDRFVLPFPFSRGLVLWGDAMFVGRNTDKTEVEAARLALEESLNALTRQADGELGYEATDPGPVAPPREKRPA